MTIWQIFLSLLMSSKKMMIHCINVLNLCENKVHNSLSDNAVIVFYVYGKNI